MGQRIQQVTADTKGPGRSRDEENRSLAVLRSSAVPANRRNAGHPEPTVLAQVRTRASPSSNQSLESQGLGTGPAADGHGGHSSCSQWLPALTDTQLSWEKVLFLHLKMCQTELDIMVCTKDPSTQKAQQEDHESKASYTVSFRPVWRSHFRKPKS